MARECPSCRKINQTEEIFCSDCGLDLTKTRTGPVAMTLSNNRRPAPDGKTDAMGNPLMVLPRDTVLKGNYKINYFTAGGMGAIYLAEEINSSQKFVIKEAYSASSKIREDFIIALTKERETLIRLDHPGIVKAKDFFQENDACYLVMEYIDGKSLESYQQSISTKDIDQDRVIEWGITLCDILIYLHNLRPQLIYRDLKPANILLTAGGDIKLIDFGIARIFKEEALKDTIPFGTHGFAAPEQYGSTQTDIRSDIYSLGATLHYLLTSRDPRDSQNLFIFPPVTDLNPHISPELEQIVLKALQIDQDKRYSSVEEMAEALKGLRSLISVRPGFFKLDPIEYGTGKTLELKITNTGKGILKGEVFLPDSFPGLEVNKKTFTGDTTIEITINTSLLNRDESYRDNIVIFSSGGNSYIPLSFEVIKSSQKESKEEKKEGTIEQKKIDDRWKTKIVDIAPVSLPAEEICADKPSQRRHIRKYALISSLILIILTGAIFLSFTSIKYFYQIYHEKNLRKESLKLLQGCKICFVDEGDNQGKTYNIFSMNPDGTDIRNLTKSSSWDTYPSWSPEGNKIAFSSNRNKFYKIYIMNSDGSNPVRLTRDSLDATAPAWSPDGTKIAFQSFYEDNYEIFSIKSDGTRLVNLTSSKSANFSPSWSPDGKFIVFESKRDGKKDVNGVVVREIYIMKSNGDNPVRITNNSYDDFSPSWSHDSSKIAFITGRDNNYDVCTVNIDGTNLFQVTHSKYKKASPQWSSDGKKIFFSSYRDSGWEKIFGIKDRWEIYSVNSDGTDCVKLLDSGGKEMSINFSYSKGKVPGQNEPYIELIRKNFDYISKKNFLEAYNLRSERVKSLTSYENFCHDWKNNIWIKIEQINMLKQEHDRAEVEVIIISSDLTKEGKTFTGKYKGSYHVILEKGSWKIDDSKVFLMEN